MEKINKSVEKAKEEFREFILASDIATTGLEKDQYTRYLQMQYHLVKDVQKQFYEIAGRPEIFNRRKFSEFLLEFGTEEGPHFKMAERDLRALETEVGESPFDVKLWWAYFSQMITERPFLRLGGTCVLENVGSAVGDLIDAAISKSDFLNQKNTTFLILHKHETLNHGEQILEALAGAELTPSEEEDVLRGIEESKTLFFRMFQWVLKGKNIY